MRTTNEETRFIPAKRGALLGTPLMLLRLGSNLEQRFGFVVLWFSDGSLCCEGSGTGLDPRPVRGSPNHRFAGDDVAPLLGHAG